MNFHEITKKYNYDSNLAGFLYQIYNELIDSLGKEFEPIIYEAFLNTEIVNCNNTYDCLLERGILENDEGSIVSNSDLKRASGIYKRIPLISYDEQSGKFEIVATKGIIAISNLDLDKEYKKGAIVHEIGHMVKGYYQEFSIEGNILITRNGLIEIKEELSFVNGKIVKKVISEKGVGLEEGLNSMLELSIAKKIVNPKYHISGYGLVASIAQNFLDDSELRKMILNAQMLKDKNKFIKAFDEYFMEGSYETLEEIVDRLYQLILRQLSEIFDKDKMQTTTDEINRVILEEYNPLINKMIEARNSKRNVG